MTPFTPVRYATVLSAVLCCQPSLAAAEAPVVPPQELAYCTVCHGVDLKGNRNIQAPRLSGMESWYVERQLEAFTSGWRGTHDADLAGIEMRPMAQALSPRQVGEAARYVGAVRSERPEVTVEGDTVRGAALYQSCAACHGPQGNGNESLGGPALTTQNDWYLLIQLKNYKNGFRGHVTDDVYGQQMRAAALLLENDESIQDVVAYISILQHKEEN